jgi:hypothetical protein
MKRLRDFLHLGIGESMATVTGYRRPLGYQQIANATLAAAVGITLPVNPPGLIPGYAVIQCNGGVVRWRDDGVAPTATVGMSIPASGELDYCGDMSKIQFISSSGTPILDVSIYA